jgi:hypothetical protein
MPKALLSVIALFLTIGLASADVGPTVKVYEYGTYSSPPSIVAGFTRRGMEHGAIPHIDLVQSTRTVIGQIGTTFGFRYRVEGEPLGRPLPITIVMRFPAPGMVAAGISLPFADDEYTVVKRVGSDHFTTWTFEEKAQIVPGIWTFEIWHENKKLAEEKFVVILPPIA